MDTLFSRAIRGRNTKWEPIVEIMGFNLSLSLSLSLHLGGGAILYLRPAPHACHADSIYSQGADCKRGLIEPAALTGIAWNLNPKAF